MRYFLFYLFLKRECFQNIALIGNKVQYLKESIFCASILTFCQNISYFPIFFLFPLLKKERKFSKYCTYWKIKHKILKESTFCARILTFCKKSHILAIFCSFLYFKKRGSVFKILLLLENKYKILKESIFVQVF